MTPCRPQPDSSRPSWPPPNVAPPHPLRGRGPGLDKLEKERLVPALRRFAADLADPTGDLVVAALVLAARPRGPPIVRPVGIAGRGRSRPVGHGAASRGGKGTDPDVDQGGGRLDVAFAAGLILLNRSYLAPFGTPLGQGVLAIIGLLFGGAFWWLARMGRPVPPETVPRPLTGSPAVLTGGRTS